MSDSTINPRIAPPIEPTASAVSKPAVGPMANDTTTAKPNPTQPADFLKATPKGTAKKELSLGLAPAPAADPMSPPKKQGDDGWKVRLYFGMNRTKYYNSDVQIRSPHLNVDIKDMEWKERTSAEFYNPKNWGAPNNPFQWIDEPTNTFVISATKGKNEFMVSAFHPKYLLNPGQEKHVTGTVDGVAIDGVQPLAEPFDGYNRQPGELYMSDIRNTHMQMDFQVGYGREFEIFKTPKNSSLVYRPAVYAGVMMGKTYSAYEHTQWNHTGYEDKVRVHGVTAAIGNKLEYRIRDRVSVHAEYKVTGAMLNQKVYGGTAKYNMLYTPLNFGIGVKLYDQNKHQ